MRYYEMVEAVNEARNTINNADHAVARLVPLMVGRIRTACNNHYIDPDHLRQLKKELEQFDMRTGKWK